MKIASDAALKGGVGKTEIIKNLAEDCAKNGYKVLLLDGDHQCNLSHDYGVYDVDGSIENIFTSEEEIKIHHIKDNLNLIAGSMNLDEIEKSLETDPSKDMLMYMWFEDNFDKYHLDEYDFILIDCRPDFSTVTRNAAVVSHAILSPITPSQNGYSAKFNLEERLERFKASTIDYKTRESFVTAELFFVANMIKHNTKSSRDFLAAIEDDDRVIARIPYKELFNRSALEGQSVIEMQSDDSIYLRNKEFYDTINREFSKIREVIMKIDEVTEDGI